MARKLKGGHRSRRKSRRKSCKNKSRKYTLRRRGRRLSRNQRGGWGNVPAINLVNQNL